MTAFHHTRRSRFSRAFLFLSLLLPTAQQALAQGIDFAHDTTLAAVKTRARKAGKPIFVDCYTTWCGPCKWMAKNTFPNDTVGRFFNENFVSVKLDMEKGEGKRLAAAYKIMFYPTLLFLDTAGREMHRVAGSQNPKTFVETGRQALNTETRLSALKNRYKKGERNPAFIRQYINGLQTAGEQQAAAEISDWYFATVPASEVVSKEHFELAERSVYQMYQPGFRQLLGNRQQFAALVGEKWVKAKIEQVYDKSFNECFRHQLGTGTETVNEELYAQLVADIKASGFEGTETILEAQHIRYLNATGQWSAYVEALKKHVPVHMWNDANGLNSTAWYFYEKTSSKEELELALAWSKRSLELQDVHYFNDTYAALCHKLGRKKEALKYAEKALEQAKAAGENTSEYEARIAEIKKS